MSTHDSQIDADYFDLDDEERYGELVTNYDKETGEPFVINPIMGYRVYVEAELEALDGKE
jgi:hypothetical protein